MPQALIASATAGNSSRDASTICLEEKDLLMSVSDFERFLFSYLVPPVILLGVAGNVLNLSVLMSPVMKTRSNRLLAALAFADMLYLVLMLPHSLVHLFFMNNAFRLFYLVTKIHLMALQNWTSSAGIWFVLSVCLERLIGIKYPLHARKMDPNRTRLLILSIIVGTGVLTQYQHFSYKCYFKYFCNGTQLHSYCYDVTAPKWLHNQPNPNSELRKLYAKWSVPMHAIFVVFIPNVVIIIANAMLIWTIRNRQELFERSASNGSSVPPENHRLLRRQSAVDHHNITQSMTTNKKSSSGGSTATHSRKFQGSSLDASASSSTDHHHHLFRLAHHLRIEQKVTITVCAIVSCFTITQTPSAIVLAASMSRLPATANLLYHLRTISFALVVLGKSLNFVLFCLSSKNFRNRLREKLLSGSQKSRSSIQLSSLLKDKSKKPVGGVGKPPMVIGNGIALNFERKVDV